MPNPKRRHTRARRDTRRAQNWKLEVPNVDKCTNCGAARLPHRICPACGFYKDRVVLVIKDKPAQEAQPQ